MGLLSRQQHLVKILLMAMIVAVLATALSACGSDSSTADEIATIPKAEFIKQGNQLCKQAIAERNSEISKFEKKAKQSGKKINAALAEEMILVVALPPVREMSEALSELGSPSQGNKEAEAIVTGFETGLDKAEKDPLSVLSPRDTPFGTAVKGSEDFGLTACAEL